MSKYAFLDTPLGGTTGAQIPPLKLWTVGTIIEKSENKAYQTPKNPVYALGLYLKKRFGNKPEVMSLTLADCAKKYPATPADFAGDSVE
ncbi:MAG: hypothetical protein WC764_02325 [Candidatus Paceibacterota bacterium]|jgi:hypothetical protein